MMYQWLPNISMCDGLPIHRATRTRTAGPVTAPCPAGSRTALCTCTLSCACARSGGRAVPAPASQAYKTAAQCARRSRTIVSWLIFRDLALQSYDRQLAHLQRSRSAVVRSSAGSSSEISLRSRMIISWLILCPMAVALQRAVFFNVSSFFLRGGEKQRYVMSVYNMAAIWEAAAPFRFTIAIAKSHAFFSCTHVRSTDVRSTANNYTLPSIKCINMTSCSVTSQAGKTVQLCG